MNKKTVSIYRLFYFFDKPDSFMYKLKNLEFDLCFSPRKKMSDNLFYDNKL
jgi:hypothetical protein